MISWFDSPAPQFDSCVLTMGNFDGLHLGHRKVLRELLLRAAELKLPPVVLTYREHPGHYIHFRHQVSILTPRQLKQQQFQELGLDQVFFLLFTSETAHVTAADFLYDVIRPRFHPALIVAGYDCHFGYQREGNAELLKREGAACGFETVQVEPVLSGGEIISSSAIRAHLGAGEIKAANAMLGRPYALYGSVTHGYKQGRRIGYPTANLNLADREQLIPAEGVYLSRVTIGSGHYFGLTNIGTNPTLKSTDQIEIETHILDFEQNVYDAVIQLDLLEYLRREIGFSSPEELRKGIAADIEQGKKLLKTYE